MCSGISCQVDPKPGCLSELLEEPAKNKAAQASPAEILAEDRWSVALILMQIFCYRFREMLYYTTQSSAQLLKVVKERWYLPYFIHEVKGLAQDHTSNP